MSECRVIEGDCLQVLPTLEAGSFDAVITDPPYPCIKRSYGTWTEAEWWGMMRAVVPQCMRLLKPSGSAVFILQPNSERVGRMRTWLWEFMLWVGKEWGIVQDVWWWNSSALPLAGANKDGLCRPSLKACVWAGPPGCWRNQSAVLLEESDSNRRDRAAGNYEDRHEPSRQRSTTEGYRDSKRRLRAGVADRGGSTPFNVLPFGSSSPTSGGTHGHGASTPMSLARWWVRYICPPGGRALDPFAGSGTVPLAALKEGRSAVGIERVPEYAAVARRRIADTVPPLFAEATP